MEKNPISFLQEEMVKRKIMPEYILIDQTVGTHINFFKMRVKCGSYTADGEASNKKEAKSKAAENMLNLLNLKNVSNKKTYNASPTVLQKSDAPTINYVGKLQELIVHSGKVVDYIYKTVTGPSHNPVFTCVCKYNDYEEEGKANNKKDAKTMAAEKMYKRVSSGCTIPLPETKIASYLSLKSVTDAMERLQIYNENQSVLKESTERAMKLYSIKSKTAIVKSSPNEQRPFTEYHTFLRNSFPNSIRKDVISKLHEVINTCKSSISGATALQLLKTVLNILKIDMEEVKYDAAGKTTVYGLKLNTNPIISEIGLGESKIQAQLAAVLQMSETLSIMLI